MILWDFTRCFTYSTLNSTRIKTHLYPLKTKVTAIRCFQQLNILLKSKEIQEK